MSGAKDISVSRPRLGREIIRWGLAAAAVVAAHAAVTYGVSAWGVGSPPNAIEEAMVVELTPLSVATPEPVQSENVSEERPDIESEIQEEVPAEAEQATEETEVEEETEKAEEPPEEVAEEEPVEEVTPVPEVKKAEVVLPRPTKPKPVKKPEPRKPAPKKQETPVKKQVRKPEKPSDRASASSKASAGAPSRSSRAELGRWYSQVRAAVARRKPRSVGQSGRVVVRFVVNASGAVVSAAVSSSSGNSTLDRAAVAMARGARVPAPPSGAGSSFPMNIPVVFD